MSTIIVNSIVIGGDKMGVFTLQEEGSIPKILSRRFGVKTLENVDTATGEPIVQIIWHDANEVFSTNVSGWVVNGQAFTASGTLCAALEEVVSERRLITGDEVTAATVNGELVAKDDTTLVFTDMARQSVLSSVSGQVSQNTSDIEGIRQDLAGKEHFRGYYTTTAEVQALANPAQGDFAYNAETGTKWAYSGTAWEDTLTPVPDQTVEPSDTIPLMDGTVSAGTENKFSRGDHRHPPDSSRALQTDMVAVQQALQLTITGATLGGAAVGVLNKILQLPAYPTALPANGGAADTLSALAINNQNLLTYLDKCRIAYGYNVTNAPRTDQVFIFNISTNGTRSTVTAVQISGSEVGRAYNATSIEGTWSGWRMAVFAETNGDIIAFKTS